MGRLAALLEGDAAFAQLALPGLLDAQAPAAAVQLHACAAHVLAALTGFCGRSGTMYGPLHGPPCPCSLQAHAELL